MWRCVLLNVVSLLGREWVPHVYPQPAAWNSRTVILLYQNNLIVKECFGLAFIYYRYFCLSDKFSFCFQSVIAVHSSDQQTHSFNSETENASINSKVNILHQLKVFVFDIIVRVLRICFSFSGGEWIWTQQWIQWQITFTSPAARYVISFNNHYQGSH